jgi:hypothetical protein
MATSHSTPALHLSHTRTTKNHPRPKVKKAGEKAVSPIELLNLLWDADVDFISGSGSHSDTFIGPNKILRKGMWDVEDDRIQGIEYEAIITVKKLIPARTSVKNAA